VSLKIYCAGPVGPHDWRTTLVDPSLLQISAQEIAAMLAAEADFHWPLRPHDARKDRFLSKRGWTVLRFTGTEIFRDVERCIEEIRAHLRKVKGL